MDTELAFAYEDVEAIVKGSLATTLEMFAFDEEKADAYTNGVIDSVLKGLQALQRPFKYAGPRCSLMMRRGKL